MMIGEVNMKPDINFNDQLPCLCLGMIECLLDVINRPKGEARSRP